MLFTIFFACTTSETKTQIEELPTLEETEEEGAEPPKNGGNIFVHDNLQRQFRIHIPENLTSDAPLVVVMHGYTSSAEVIEGYSGMNNIADENGFVVAYPQGTKDGWGNNFFNVGYEFHESTVVDDIGYIHALISYLQESLQLSQSNVFAMGMSNGGDMSYMLACQSNVIRAIAPVAGCMMRNIYETCEPSRDIPVLEIHGTVDDITLVDGDLEDEYGWGAYMPLQDTIQFWVEHNQLDKIDIQDVEDIDDSDGSTVVHHRHYSENNTTEVWLYEVIDGGHDWPGAFGNKDVDASQLAWQFFSKYID